MAQKYASLAERIIANTALVDGPLDTPCWIYLGHLDRNGYGRMSLRIDGRHRKVKVHRLAVEVFRGIDMPPEVMGLHLCSVRPCANPMHVEPGTESQNSLQREAEKRMRREA